MRSVLSILYLLGYILLIVPPRAIDLTAEERAQRGELSNLPLFAVMVIELLIRIALVLIVAVSSESLITNTIYETYRLDTVFSIVVLLGTCHSLFYYLLLGYMPKTIGLGRAMRLYRLMRNLCYAPLPGLLVAVPILALRWRSEQPPFEDGVILEVYMFTTVVMLGVGIIEALIMKRKPLGLDDQLGSE